MCHLRVPGALLSPATYHQPGRARQRGTVDLWSSSREEREEREERESQVPGMKCDTRDGGQVRVDTE